MTGLKAQQQNAIGSGRESGTIERAVRLLAAGALVVSIACGAAQGGLNEWTSGGPGGGDIASLAVDPSQPEIVYAGTLAGVFKSADGGTSWRVTGLTGTAVAAVAIDPLHVTTLYAGTRTGVWKSTDGADHWTATALRDVAIDALVIDPSDALTVFAGSSYSTLFKSTDGGSTWQPSNAGLPDPFYLQALALDPHLPSTVYAGGGDTAFPLRRSTDGGRTWQVVELPAGHCCIVFAIAFDPETPSIIYLSAGGDLLKSDDGGTSWEDVDGPVAQLRFVELVIDPVTTTTLYALVEEGGPSGDGAVYKSADAGRTWHPSGLGGLDFRELRALAIDGAGSTLYASTNRALLKSIDGAANWSPTALPGGGTGGVAIDPSQPARLYAASSVGIFRSVDRGASWLRTGLHDPVHQVVVDPAMPSTIYAVAVGSIVKTLDDGATWNPAENGIREHDTYALVIDPTNSHVLYAATGGGVFKSTDAAQHWTRMNEGITYTLDSLAIAPSDPLTLYGGTYREGVFATHDGAATWRQVLGYGRADGVIVDPTNGTVYAAYQGGQKSRNGGQTWQPAAFPSAIDPTDPDTLYVGLNKSADGGATFSALPPLPLDPVYSYVSAMVIHPAEPTRLYAATYAGVFSLDQDPDAATPTTTPIATPTPPPSSFVREVSVDPPRPRVGDTITLRFSVDVVGTPQFALDGALPLLEFRSPPITEAQAPGTVSFTLQAIAAGTAELRLQASYEFVDCSDACTIDRISIVAEPFALQIAPASSGTGGGGGCSVDARQRPGVVLLSLPIPLLILSRRRARAL